jgi:hypothetical protein
MGRMDRHHFVFVCGLQRSGTTMLYRSLGDHPSISALSGGVRATNEGQHNQTVYPADEHHSKGGQFAFRPEARMLEDSPLVTDANRRKLFDEWSRHWDTSKPFLLEKSPPNLIRMRFLQAMFPESSFVALLRHPIPVTLATQKWGKIRPHRLLQHWLRAHELMASDVPHIRRLHVVRYEDLIADPDTALSHLFSFLGLDDHTSGRDRAEGVNQDNFEADRTLRLGVNDRYFEMWKQRRTTLVRRLYYDACALRYDRPARRFGYSMRRPGKISAPKLPLPGLTPGVASPAAQPIRVS